MKGKAIAEVITSLAQCADDELYALSESQLAEQWYFRWDNSASDAWNLYEFSSMLEMHKRRCRRWEEHHHGSMCVVERVRDKYLMPRIKTFLFEYADRLATRLSEMMDRSEMANLTKKEAAAMREFKALVAKGHAIGRRRIVSMQALEKAGLVQRITYNGMIADWRLTPAGEEWQG
jgi:hypothetical protein